MPFISLWRIPQYPKGRTTADAVQLGPSRPLAAYGPQRDATLAEVSATLQAVREFEIAIAAKSGETLRDVSYVFAKESR